MTSSTGPPTGDDRTKWRSVPIAERIALAQKLIVLHPRFRDAVALLDRCHQSFAQPGEPACGALLGTSGVGKTSVVDHPFRLHLPFETGNETRRTVLKVTLQPDARPKGIAADLLLALGDPAWSSGTVQSLTSRAVKLLARCGVELIVFDEFHHLFDMERARVMTKAAQWLKVLIVNTRIPVVVCGMPEAEHVLRAEHTERRFKERLTLRCFTWRTPAGRKEFCGMLKRLDTTLPVAESSELAEPGTAGRFFLACRGIPDYLMTLIRGGLAEALGRGSERIEFADLARVFERQLAHQRILAEQANPFVGAWDASALDRVAAADEIRGIGVGLSPRAGRRRPKPITATQLLGGP
jgi:GNAT superfamily N-acetyltransferase